MRTGLSMLMGLMMVTTASAGGDNPGRCSPKHLAGTWAATFQAMVPVDDPNDGVDGPVPTATNVSCSFTVDRDGVLVKSACSVGTMSAVVDPVEITGSLTTSRGCFVSGEFVFGGETYKVSGKATRDRELVVGTLVAPDDSFQQLVAIRTSAVRGYK